MDQPSKKIFSVLYAISIGISILWSHQLIITQKKLSVIELDHANINKINNGIFDISRWKKEALKVFEKRIGEFEISDKAYDQVVKELEKYLQGVYRDHIENGKILEPIFVKAESNPKVNKMILKMLKENTLPQIIEINIPSHIPKMARDLAKELRKQEPQLRDVMREELKKIIKDTVPDHLDPRFPIYQQYGFDDHKRTNDLLISEIEKSKSMVDLLVLKVASILLILFITTWISVYVFSFKFGILGMTMITIVMLYLGVTLPMINIEGLLNSFTINVLGTDISFDPQYMYYQSKSIIDVTKTLIESRGIDTRIVGIMILAFSVLFPLTKLLLTVGYLFSSRIQKNQTIQNIIFYLGKWSMADVFVVAMFMAYIGFNGIIGSQLEQIERNRNGVAIETINNSHLSYGALFFTSYCIASILIATFLAKRKIDSANY